jgi:exodeoxyribonuclease V alpha subunit
MPEVKIQGVLERIIFRNEETSFTVAKIKEERKKELTSIVGNLIGVNPRETLELQGR